MAPRPLVRVERRPCPEAAGAAAKNAPRPRGADLRAPRGVPGWGRGGAATEFEVDRSLRAPGLRAAYVQNGAHHVAPGLWPAQSDLLPAGRAVRRRASASPRESGRRDVGRVLRPALTRSRRVARRRDAGPVEDPA